MSHWSNAARKSYIVLHHVGSPGTFNNNPLPYVSPYTCNPGSTGIYDFAVGSAGQIAVGARYTNPSGCHAKQCNCEATGIVMTGCFGGNGCGSADTVSAAQKCGVAYIWQHTGITRDASKLRPHRWCKNTNPCNHSDGPSDTVCFGTRYTHYNTANDYLNATGVGLRNEILSMANNGCIVI
jgi:hypothetical protein